MYIKMKENKSLIVTKPSVLYKGEYNVDNMTFFVPEAYANNSEIEIVYVHEGLTEKTETLKLIESGYKGYCLYQLTVDTNITSNSGRVIIHLVFKEDGITTLKSGDVCFHVYDNAENDGEGSPSATVIRADWEQNNPEADDYIANRPFYRKNEANTYLYDSFELDQDGYYQVNEYIDDYLPVTEGETYEVTVGNYNFMGLCANKEGKLTISYSDSDFYVCKTPEENGFEVIVNYPGCSGLTNVSVVGFSEVIKQIDPEFIKEEDPTVPEWAKSDKKPTYTPVEIGIREFTNLELDELLK